MNKISICEIFKSIQGEGAYSGFPFSFIRTAGCSLNCTYCDTEYAKAGGEHLPINQVISEVKGHSTFYICITGGEPLEQKSTLILIEKLLIENQFKKIILETNGSRDISKISQPVHISMDLKTPGSGMEMQNSYDNLDYLKVTDDLKFTITSKTDFRWVLKQYNKFNLERFNNISISPVSGLVEYEDAAQWILESGLNLRLNIQLHKIIWKGNLRGK